MSFLEFKEEGFYISFSLNEEGIIYIDQFSTTDHGESHGEFPLIQVHASGYNQNDHHARKHTGCEPGSSLRYKTHLCYDNDHGKKLEVALTGDVISAYWHLQHFQHLKTARIWCEIHNHSQESIGLEYVSSLTLFAIDSLPWEKNSVLHLPHNNWYGEAQWKRATLPELGLDKVNRFSLDRFSIENTGTWSSIGYLPCAAFEDLATGTTLLWQIEHNGSWQWEIGDFREHLYLQISGPTENENHWWKQLMPGETFTSVPVAVSLVQGGLQEALQEITRYRRRILRPSQDNIVLPVIFNDYMNCLFGDPTTEKLLPLIDIAAVAGCEYFCIDCGWYSDGEWWDGVGEWQPSTTRFPRGIREPIDYIAAKGMKPGLWLELEVIGITCPLAQKLPDECFFQRHGKRVIDHQRYQLDFRHPLVQEHADRVIARLVDEYGISYIKMDYNINAGSGTDYQADSTGDGLLQHNRAYLSWLIKTMNRYPHLVIENCGSGGLRMDYALLQHHSIQSVTDQTDYRLMAVIASSAASAVTPEQAAIWSYPLREGDREEVVMNMINSMLLRIHQSGHLAELSEERFLLVKEGIALYKTFREKIPHMTPFWPLGMPSMSSPWLAFGLYDDNDIWLAVWRMDSAEDTISLPLPIPEAEYLKVNYAYPQFDKSEYASIRENNRMEITLHKKFTARLLHCHH
ncbi:alpha-galactosidase [Klebsiella quasipneumoniae subsp. quasipneumoniae]|uniref:glycoside hydrolase family 36 protein n=1 Tax=Klebsiella quasipneumoniae TaxID=1463165 RepID=UPI001E62CEA2|nr:glycoside hydrolase family 36 protein [Klebsiella quasipneumoniae]MCD7094907.1 alpha-galactosidase [Klebsiella quasipneumoniae subsp. similipneumoniae]